MNYGKAIAVVRKARGLRRRQLATALWLPGEYISMLENGIKIPSVQVLESISAVLHCPLFLLVLLASEVGDIQGLPQEQMGEIGIKLLATLLQHVDTIPDVEPKEGP